MHVCQAQWAYKLNQILTTAVIICGPLAGLLSGIQAVSTSRGRSRLTYSCNYNRLSLGYIRGSSQVRKV